MFCEAGHQINPFRNFASVSRDKQVKAAAICPLSLVARLWVVLVEMSFSVRVHPAPFSPTPNRHAGIGLKMKGGGPGGSRLGQKSLASSIPGWRGARGAGLQKEVCSLTHPPLQAQALAVALRLGSTRRRRPSVRAGTLPLSPPPFLPLFPLGPRHLALAL